MRAQYPTNNESFTPETLVFASTGVSGALYASGAVSFVNLTRGQSFILGVDNGSAQGFTDLKEYFAIPIDNTHFKLAETHSDAMNSLAIGSSGNAKCGKVYPCYKIGGKLYVGTTGDVNIRGIENGKEGSTAFSVLKNVANATMLDMYFNDITSYLTTATNMVKCTFK